MTDQWCNGKNECLECGDSLVRATVGSKPNSMKLLFVASPLCTQH